MCGGFWGFGGSDSPLPSCVFFIYYHFDALFLVLLGFCIYGIYYMLFIGYLILCCFVLCVLIVGFVTFLVLLGSAMLVICFYNVYILMCVMGVLD